MNFKIKTDDSTGQTGIVIRRNGIYINVVSRDSLENFLKDNLPSGTFARKGNSLVLQQSSAPTENARDEEGHIIRLDELAESLGYTFETVRMDERNEVKPLI